MSNINNKIIAVTTGSNTCSEDFVKLTNLGAQVFFIPTIKIVPVNDYESFDTALAEIYTFDFLLFTSVNSVNFFKRRLNRLNITVDYSRLKVACVGDKTAESCKHYNIPVTITPKAFNASSLADEFRNLNISNKKILIPCSAIARQELKIQLQEMGNKVQSIPVYDVQIPPEEELAEIRYKMNNNKINLIAFTSPSSFYNFKTILGISKPEEYFNNIAVAAIGNTTKDSIILSGLKVDIVPEVSTLKGLAESIINFYN